MANTNKKVEEQEVNQAQEPTQPEVDPQKIVEDITRELKMREDVIRKLQQENAVLARDKASLAQSNQKLTKSLRDLTDELDKKSQEIFSFLAEDADYRMKAAFPQKEGK